MLSKNSRNSAPFGRHNVLEFSSEAVGTELQREAPPTQRAKEKLEVLARLGYLLSFWTAPWRGIFARSIGSAYK